MPEVQNFSPFPNFRYYSMDNAGRDFGVVIVKATYELDNSGTLVVAEEQAPMVFSDECHGAVNQTSLWHPSDLVPNKPRCDVIVNAIARTQEGMPLPQWECGIKVERDGQVLVSKLLSVTGPRSWVPRWKRQLSDDQQRDWKKHRGDFERWELSDPEPVSELPLHYELAFGGLLQRGTGENGQPIWDDIHENPIGRGWMDREWTDHTKRHPAPQIVLAGEQMANPYELRTPQSLGPIPCAWEPRLPKGGSYDTNWQQNIWPNWPPDYDFAYHNSAHPDLICPHYLRGDERVSLKGTLADAPLVSFDLPRDRMAVEFVVANGEVDRREMNLDTLFLDVAAPKWRDWRVYLSWRVNFEPEAFSGANIIYLPPGVAPGAGGGGSIPS